MVWVLHYSFFGSSSVEFSKDRKDFVKDITRYQNYLSRVADENKQELFNDLIQEYYNRKDEFYEGFFFAYANEFICLELNNKISIKD